MAWVACGRSLLLILAASLGGCGLIVPEKHIFPSNGDQPGLPSNWENMVVSYIHCELRKGIYEASTEFQNAAWFVSDTIPDQTKQGRQRPDPVTPKSDQTKKGKKGQPYYGWGVSVTLAITVDELSGLNPGVSLNTPLENSVRAFPAGGNVVVPQSFSFGLGLSGSAHATRSETIQYTLENKDLLKEAQNRINNGYTLDCGNNNGITIDSDLKIAQFIRDKLFIEPSEVSSGGFASTAWPPYDTFQEQLTFVVSFGGSITPTWKFARIAVDPTSTLLSATRTNTNTLTITFGPIQSPATPTSAAVLSQAAQAQRASGILSNQTASAIGGQTH
jgi:hypothetical protein